MLRNLKSRKAIFFEVVSACLFGVCLAVLVLFANISNATGLNFWNPSLMGESPEQLGQYAINFATRQSRIESGTPQVALVKFVKPEDLSKLGLDSPNFGGGKVPPLVLVILKGDFGWGNVIGSILPSAMEQARFTYISYVFDMHTGEFISTISTKDGSIFRNALTDTTLPNYTPNVNEQEDNTIQPTATPAEPFR